MDSYEIDAETAALLEEVYLNGLGEFAYRNGLDLHGRIRFPGSEPSPSTKPALKPSPSRGGFGGDGFPPSPTETHPHPGPPLEGAGEMPVGSPEQLALRRHALRSDVHTSQLQSLMRISSPVFCFHTLLSLSSFSFSFLFFFLSFF